MQALLDRTAAENQQLRETQIAHGAQTSQALSTLPMLIEQLTLAQSRPARERSLVDTRGIGKPQTSRDDESSFTVWRKKTEGYILSTFPGLREPLEWAMDRAKAITWEVQDATYGASAGENEIEGLEDFTRQLHTLLIHITDGESFDSVNATEEWNGLEA